MNAIYFPFTYISEQTATTITTIFKQLTVYLPAATIIPIKMKTLSAAGMLDIRTPIEKDEERLLAANKEYIQWGNTHQKNVISSLKNRPETPYLFDDSWVSQIKTDIQKKFKKETRVDADNDFAARLFLLITQEHDQYHQEMTQDVQSIERMEQSLFKDLRADDFQTIPEESEPLSTGFQDPGMYMTKERLASWYTLMRHDQNPPCHFYITTSPGIWEYILEFSDNVELIPEDIATVFKESTSKGLPQKPDEIVHVLQKAQWSSSTNYIYATKITTPHEIEVNVKFLIIPDTQPEDFFCKFTQKTPTRRMPKHTKFQNIVIGMIQ